MRCKCLTLFAFLVCTLISCSKNSDNIIDPPEVPDTRPLQLIKKILRYKENGQIIADSTGYTYDERGRLTATLDLRTNLPTRKFVYEGDNMTAIIGSRNGQPDTLKNIITLLDNGNTIFIDFTGPNQNGGIDTIQITYKWSGNQLLESWTYLHLASMGFPTLQKSVFSYDANGNEFEHAIIFNDGGSQWQTRGAAYDQKKNFFSTLDRLSYVFIGWGFPYATRSVNNPVKGERPFGDPIEYIWTYNEEDYPLTMQVKGESYVTLELQYNK